MAFTIVLGLAILSAANYGNAFEFSGLDPSVQSKTQLTPTIKPANQPQDQIKSFGLKNAGTKPFGVPSFDSLKSSYQPYQPPGPFRTNYQPFGPYPGYPGPVVYPGGHGGYHGGHGGYHGGYHGGHDGHGGYPGPGAFPHPPSYRFDGADHKPFGFRPPYYPEQPVQQTYPTHNSPFKFGPSKKFNKNFPAFAEFNQPGKYYQEHQFGAYHGPEFSSAVVPAEHNVKSSKPKDTLLGKPAVPNLSEFGLSKQGVYGFAAPPQSFHSFAGYHVPNFPPIPPFFGTGQPSVKTASSTAAAEQKAVDELAAAVTVAAVPSPSQDGSPATPQQVPVAKAEEEEVTGEPSAAAAPAADAQPAQEGVAEVATNNEVPAAADDAAAVQQQQSGEPTEVGEPGAVDAAAAADGETPVDATKEPVVVAADPSVQGSSDTSVQGSSDTSVQGSSDSSVQGSSDPSVQGSSDTSVQGSSDSSVQGSSDPSVQGSSDSSVQGSSDSSVQGSSDGPSAQEVPANGDGPAVDGGSSDAAQAADEKSVQQNAVTATNVASGLPNELAVPGVVNEAPLALSDPSSVGLFSGYPYFGQSADFQQAPPSYVPYYNNEPKFTDEELRAALAGSGFGTGFLQSPEFLGSGVSQGVNGAGVIVSKSTVPVAIAPSAKGVGKTDGNERKETVGSAVQSNVAAATTPNKSGNTVQILPEDPFNRQLPLLYDPSNAGSPLDAFRFYSQPPVSALSGQASLASYSPEDAFSSFGSQFRQGYLVAGSQSPLPVARTVVQTVGQTPISIASKDHPLHSEIFKYPQSFVPYPQVVSSAGSARSLEAPSPSSPATSVTPLPVAADAAADAVPSTAPTEAAVRSTSSAKTVV